MTAKRLLIIFTVSMLFLLPALYSSQNPSLSVDAPAIGNEFQTSADGDAWLSGYRYRQDLNFVEYDGAGTNYQIKIHVEHDAAIGATNAVNCDDHCQENFGDVRFTDGDGDTELDYWMEEKTDTDDATFWVEVSDSLNGTDTDECKIYIYYGTSGTSSTTSNGTATFLFFDNFNDASLDTSKWTERWSDGSYSESGGILSLSGTGGSEGITSDVEYGVNHAIGSFMKFDEANNNDFGWDERALDGTYSGAGIDLAQVSYRSGAQSHRVQNDAGSQTNGRAESLSSYSTVEIQWFSSKVEAFIGGSSVDSEASNTPTDNMGVFLYTYGTNVDVFFDWVYIRKCIDTEPYILTSGNTEVTSKVDNVSAEFTNPDEGNHLFAEYKVYELEIVVEIESGYTDLDYVYVIFKQGVSGLGEWKYDEDVDTFYNMAGLSLCDTGASTAVGDGLEMTITFHITIDWAQNDLEEYFLNVASHDVFTTSDVDDYGDYDVETRLDLSPFSLSDGSGIVDRGDYDTPDGITASGTVVFYGSAISPGNTDVDVWVSCADLAGDGSPWSDLELDGGDFSMTVDSDDVVGEDTYTFIAVHNGAGSAGGNKLHAAHSDLYIADAYTVSFTVDDNRINIGENATVGYTVISDYDASAYDGTVNLNYSTWTQASVQRQGFTVSSLGGDDTDGVTSISTNDADYVIWDRVQVQSYTVVDDRVNINDNVNVDVLLYYDYDNTQVTTGTITIIGNSAVHQGSGVWRLIYSTDSPYKGTFDTVAGTGSLYGITVFDQNGQTQDVIWDSLTITAIDPTDQRINTGANASGMVFSAVRGYDGSAFDGTLTLNDTTYDHGTVGIYYYMISSASGGTYGITAIGTNDNTWCIFDEVKITWITTNSTYNDLDDYVLLTVGLTYEYDGASITAGTFSLQYGTTYLTLTHLASGNWTVTDGSAASVSRTYDSVNGTGTLYGITVINMDSKSAVCHWDKIILVITANLQWTVVGYNITLSYSGTFESNGSTWSGTVTLNSTGGTLYPVYSSAGNYTFDVVSISGIISGFDSTSVWVVWDDLSFSHGVDWYKANDYTSYYYWGGLVLPIQFVWTINGTAVEDIPVVRLQGYINGTVNDFGVISTGTWGTGYFGGILFGAFDDTWYYADLQINAQCVINSQTYNWSIWDDIVTVDILHSISFEVLNIDTTNPDYITFEYITNHENATWVSVWDNSTGTPRLVYNHTDEGSHYFSKESSAGTYPLIFLFNQSMYLSWSAQTCDITLTDDWWSWEIKPYIVTSDEIVINTYTLFGAGSDFTYMQYSGAITHDCTFVIEEWSDTWAKNETHTGSVSAGDFNIAWDKIGVNDINANYTITFTNGSLTKVITSGYITAYKLLSITDIDCDNLEASDNWVTNLTLNFNTNKNVDWYIYDVDDSDAVLGSGSSVEGTDSITWVQNTARGAHQFAVKWTDGVSEEWYNNSYWIYDRNIDDPVGGGGDPGAEDDRRTIQMWATIAAVIGFIGILCIGLVYFKFDEVKKLQLPNYDTQSFTREERRREEEKRRRDGK